MFFRSVDDEFDDLMNEGENIENLNELLETCINFPSSGNCGCHALNLIASVDIKNCCKEFTEFSLMQNDAIGKVARLWNLQNHSSKCSDEIKSVIGSLFKTGTDLRWFSKVAAIDDFLKKLDTKPLEIESFFNDHQKLIKRADGKRYPELPKILADEEMFLREYVKVIKPHQATCQWFQSEESIFWGCHAPLIKKLVDEINSITDIFYCEPLKNAILECKSINK